MNGQTPDPSSPSMSEIAELDRHELTERLLHWDGTCQLDFTEQFLDGKSTQQLRHLLLAAYKYAARRCNRPRRR